MRKDLLVERDETILTLTLHRPADGNRINAGLAQALCDVAEELEHDDSIRVVMLRARGASFCLGEETASEAARIDWVEAIAGIHCPVIAVIQGDALAEGLELALACDIRIASPQARFAMPQLTNGRLPSRGGTQRLPRLIGAGRTLEFLLSGRRMDAAEAQSIGLISRLVPHRRLSASAAALAANLAGRAPIALRYAKEAVWKGSDMTLAQGIRLEEDLYVLLQTTRDRAEGVGAFLNKRRPRFRGR